MTSMIRKLTALAGALVAIGLLAPSARADLTVLVQEDAGAIQTFTTAGSPTAPGGVSAGTVSATTTDYSIVFLSGQETQTSQSIVQSSNTSITALHASSNVLHITITGTLFTAPTSASVFTRSNIGGTVVQTSGTNTLSFTSSVNGTALPGSPQTPSITAAGSYNNTITPTIAGPLATPITIAESITILLSSSGDSMNYSSSTTLSNVAINAVPEPSTMVLVGLGALGFVGFGLRRRKALGA